MKIILSIKQLYASTSFQESRNMSAIFPQFSNNNIITLRTAMTFRQNTIGEQIVSNSAFRTIFFSRYWAEYAESLCWIPQVIYLQ